MPAIDQTSLIWLLLTFSSCRPFPAQVNFTCATVQIAIDGNLAHPHVLLAGSAQLQPQLKCTIAHSQWPADIGKVRKV
jgi:hypothetical protein